MPVPRLVVLDRLPYQLIVPALAVAANVTEPEPQAVSEVTVDMPGRLLTVIVAVLVHPLLSL